MGTRKAKLTTPHYNRLLELGSYKKLPHYCVIGGVCSFYLWRDTDGRGANTKFIVGRVANEILSRLSQLIVKDKEEFVRQFDLYYEEHKK